MSWGTSPCRFVHSCLSDPLLPAWNLRRPARVIPPPWRCASRSGCNRLSDSMTNKPVRSTNFFMHISRRRCHRPEGSALLEVWAAARVWDPAWARSVPAGWSDIPELPMESNVADIRSLPEQRMPRRSVRHGARRRRKSSARSLLRLSLRPGKTSGCAASQSFGRPGSPRRRLGRVKNSGSKQDPEFFVPGGGVRVVRPQRPSVGDGAG